MDKRGIRYQQAERMTSAESEVKALRAENADLRKQLFRAQESARIANEEATARAAAQRQSGEALREQLRQAREMNGRSEAWIATLIDEKAALIAMPLRRIAAKRIADWWRNFP